MKTGHIESLPTEARVVRFAGGSFVMPWARFRASAPELALMAMAASVAPSRPKLRDRWLNEVEARQGKEARRRARTPPEGRAVRIPTQDASSLQIGDRAIYTSDEGDAPARVQVVITADRSYELESHRPTRRVSTPAGHMIVLEHELEPCRDDWSDYDGATDLLPGKVMGLPAAEKDGGRVYAPAPFRPHFVGKHPVMEKFDRINREVLDDVLLRREWMTSDQLKDLDEAERLAGSKKRHEQVKARDMIGALQAQLLSRQIANGVERHRIETLALEAGRGDPVTIEEHGRLRKGADGLLNLLATGAIDHAQCAAGLRYRRLCALSERSLGSSMGSLEASTGARGQGADDGTFLELRADATFQIRKLEAIVQTRAAGNGRYLTTLRLVAGQGRTINAISRAGKSSDRIQNLKALNAALGLAAEFFSERPPK